MSARGRWAPVALVTALLLAACTGVPSTSSPQVIKTVGGGGQDQQRAMTPSRGELPRNLVQGFLEANALDASNAASARNFLTKGARNKWSDNTVTVVEDESVGGFEASRSAITVRAKALGRVDINGVYTPTLQGGGGPTLSFTYRIEKHDGQYRISDPYAGLLLTQQQFLASYRQRSVYFYDLAQRYLVPDPRWTSLTDPTQLITWLVNELAGGPVDALQNAVSNDTLPAQATAAHRITVTAGGPGKPTRIDVPGSSQLDGAGRNRLAAQLGQMIDEADRGVTLQITDDGTPVRVPEAGGNEFTGPEFSEGGKPPTPAAEVYYLHNGRVVDEQRKRLSGAVDNGSYFLTSVAVTRSTPTRVLGFAGVSTIAGSPTLLVGSQTAGLRRTSVTGVTSRPAFAPGRDEVWVGTGSHIKRVVVSGRSETVSMVGMPSSAPGGRIVALRLSPEGSRIALAIRTAGGVSRLYVGAVVRSNGLVRVDTLQQVSHQGAVVTDVAWLESLKLVAIGYDSATRIPKIYQVGVDGSVWTSEGIGGLPDPPTTISVVPLQRAWVTSNNSVWEQRGGTAWFSPGPGNATPGIQPVYLE